MVIFTMYMAIVNILFVCSGNTCRSPMAVALLRKKIKERGLLKKIRCDSAGLYVKESEDMSTFAKLALKEFGVNIIKHQARQFELSMLKKNKFVFTMSKVYKDRIYAIEPRAYNVVNLAEYTGGEDVPDPYGGSVENYLEIAKYLDFLMERVLNKVIKECNL